jgi:diguanylate cyclase (GGDEF)-like protein
MERRSQNILSGAADYSSRAAWSSALQDAPIGVGVRDTDWRVTATRQTSAELREGSLRDPLTRLPTGDWLRCEPGMFGVARSMLVIAVDHLAQVNRALGRDRGDQLLIEVARRLTGLSGDGDVVARLDGAEFAILLDDSDGRRVDARARRVTSAMLAPIMLGQTAVTPSFSIGTAADSAGTQSMVMLLHKADLAAHANPVNGTADWTQIAPAVVDSSARRLAIESDLGPALAARELSLAYQPIVDVADGSIRAVEALSRWTHRTLGEVTPDEFIPIAGRIGAIDELTAWVLHTACTDLATWRDTIPAAADLRVSVNVSPWCLSAPRFPRSVTSCLRHAGVPADRLILEITESALNIADATAVANAEALRASGVHLAIDDFGTGASSLARLARFPITHLKLDRCFLERHTLPEHEAPLIRAMVAMAAELDIGLIVEGVETQDHLDMLRRYGCTQAQGHLLGRPQSAARLRELLVTSTVRPTMRGFPAEPAA